jgi:2-polyprenyl-3-methyl-5-hydroxy-6-metoxy-1,4-benzoquinol methylase
MPCTCAHYDELFDARHAAKELAAYRSDGPSSATQAFLDCLLSVELPEDAMLLDVGGGIGVLGHQLIGRGVTDVALVEASKPYLEVARGVSEDLRVATRWSFHHGDVVELAEGLPEADLVTLQRVVCCYPDYQALLGAVASLSRGLIAMSYPQDRWYLRGIFVVLNLWFRIRGTSFRAFVHKPEQMHAVLEAAGFEQVAACDGWVWAVRVFRRM